MEKQIAVKVTARLVKAMKLASECFVATLKGETEMAFRVEAEGFKGWLPKAQAEYSDYSTPIVASITVVEKSVTLTDKGGIDWDNIPAGKIIHIDEWTKGKWGKVKRNKPGHGEVREFWVGEGVNIAKYRMYPNGHVECIGRLWKVQEQGLF